MNNDAWTLQVLKAYLSALLEYSSSQNINEPQHFPAEEWICFFCGSQTVTTRNPLITSAFVHKRNITIWGRAVVHKREITICACGFQCHMVYIKAVKNRKSVILFFHSAAPCLKNAIFEICKLDKRVRNTQPQNCFKIFQIPRTQSLGPSSLGRVVFTPAAHRAPTESLPPTKTCCPSSSPQSTLLFNGIYQNREKTKSVKKHFTWLRLV